MCGIIGIIGVSSVAERLILGLRQMEYRGYDSAGLATRSGGELYRQRAEGKLIHLETLSRQAPLPGVAGIGHTRWATHGLPSVANAHPHATARVAVVHNGIIENFKTLKAELQQEGAAFSSETDTEVVVHLVHHALKRGLTPLASVQQAVARLHGAFALAFLFADDNAPLIVARNGAPLAIGYGQSENYIGSDAMALAPFTTRLSYLEDGDIAALTPEEVTIWDETGAAVTRLVKPNSWNGAAIGKGEFRHFMLKEIHEQPVVVGEALGALCRREGGALSVALPALPLAAHAMQAITLVACGTSYYAALVARYWLEALTLLPVAVDIASEFRYRPRNESLATLMVFLSQSGETADTLAALKSAKAAGLFCLSVVNVVQSSIALAAHQVLPLRAGVEIGVASTKAFTAQLTALACLALHIAKARGSQPPEALQAHLQALSEAPGKMAAFLQDEHGLAELAQTLAASSHVLFMGRGAAYALALEGALKLKEISYIHAEGYAAGELKHGPIALIDDQMPVVVVAPPDAVLFEKTMSNMQEVAARGGKLIVLSDAEGCAKAADIASVCITLPDIDAFSAPLLYALPLQLLSYQVAVQKGTDVDQPRNLAKSVTVE